MTLSLCLQAISALAAVLGVASQEFVVSEHYNSGKDRIRLSLQRTVKQYGFQWTFTKYTPMDLIVKCVLFFFTGSGYIPKVKVGPIDSWARVNGRSRGNLHGYISVCCWHQSNGWCLIGDILKINPTGHILDWFLFTQDFSNMPRETLPHLRCRCPFTST